MRKFNMLTHKNRFYLTGILFFIIGLSVFACKKKDNNSPTGPENNGTRDPLKQPFHETSIWNMPIGSDAVYVPANIQLSSQNRMTVDEDVIILTPDAPITSIFENTAGWNRDKNRCIPEGGVMYALPIPSDFIYSPDTWDGLTPNASTAVLGSDGKTIYQFQPFARCDSAGIPTTQYRYPQVEIDGDGTRGAHGGSGLSSIGGTIRLGELVPGGKIPHAMKMNLWGQKNYYYSHGESDGKAGYRWPAVKADGYADGSYNGSNKALQMGSLLALKPDFDVSQLVTEAAQILAEAFMNYGAYIVDDTAWDVYALCTEHGPAGIMKDEFKQVWGYSFSAKGTDSPWKSDYKIIIENLHVVDNNGPDAIGGGGEPLVPMAEPLQ